MRVTEADIFPDTKDIKAKKNRPTQIELRAKGPFGELSQMIKLTYKTGYLIVQTDKPLYTPRQDGI